MTNRESREFDVVLVGATGFVGRLTAAHLAQAAPDGARIALAGRDQGRVDRARDTVGRADWPTVVVDVTDRAQADALAGRARVVISTVGPYRTYGRELVAACAAAGTDYVDLTGEVLFVAAGLEENHGTAQRTGARIVHSCGFDSIPSDLGMDLVRQEAVRQGQPAPEMARMYVFDTRGGVSGGTVASLVGQLHEVRSDPQARHTAADPLALAPGAEGRSEVPSPVLGRDPAVENDWIAPFVMESYNSRVVQRTRFLRGDGPLAYREYIKTGPGLKGLAGALAVTAGTLGGVAAISLGGSLVERLLPKPGQGPSEGARAGGRYTARTIGLGNGRRYEAEFADHRDPGYGSTAVMLGESALALAFDDLPTEGGVLTPAFAIGDRLVQRLREQGFRISVRTF